MCFSILVLYISQNFLTFLISFLNTFPAANELTEKRDTIISYFSYNSGALAKGGMKEVTVNDIPTKSGYTRNLFLADVSGTGSNSVTVNLHGGSVSFYSPLVEANVTARIGCIYTRD